ncbi:MAG: flagellin [Planctomycetota bacterium]
MARINTNVGALIAQRNLNNSYKSLNGTLERLATGLRINHGKDDPAGLIVSERLRSETAAVSQAISNTQRASLIISTTEGALDEVAALLRDIQGKIVEAANEGGFSDEEIRANQLQIDSAIASITRIANSTTFAGRHLLNGSLDYITSGVSDTQIAALNIKSAQFGSRDYIPVNVEVTQSAQPAELYYRDGTVPSEVTIEIQGNAGVTTLSFIAGATAASVVSAINAISDSTGVIAELSANPTSGFVMKSTGLGSSQFVSVQRLPGGGSFDLTNADNEDVQRDEGRDATATINGTRSTGDGNLLRLKTATLDVDLALASDFGLGQTSFAITAGGALYQIGAHVTTNLQVNIGVQSVAASRLGNSSVGYLSQIVTGSDYSLVSGHFAEASKIVDEAIEQVSVLRGRLGAFEKNTLDTNIDQLSITMENLMSSESSIRDADFAYETSQLARNQVLANASTAALSLANQTPQLVLQLLSG